MSATMSATKEPEDLLELEQQQSDRRRSRPILLSPPSGDGVDTREQKQAVHLLLLPEEAEARPYQHGCDYVGSDSADDECCDLELVSEGSCACWRPQLIECVVVKLYVTHKNGKRSYYSYL